MTVNLLSNTTQKINNNTLNQNTTNQQTLTINNYIVTPLHSSPLLQQQTSLLQL